MARGVRVPAARAAREDGGVLVEFALVVPILLMIFAGIVDFGLMMQRREVVTNAAPEGARIAVLPGYGNCNPANVADVRARVNAYLNDGIAAGASANANVTQAIVQVAVGVGPPVESCRVTVTYTTSYSILGPLRAAFGGANFGAITLTGTSTMRREVPGP
jgi:Flp pilus assembly protein TadG